MSDYKIMNGGGEGGLCHGAAILFQSYKKNSISPQGAGIFHAGLRTFSTFSGPGTDSAARGV